MVGTPSPEKQDGRFRRLLNDFVKPSRMQLLGLLLVFTLILLAAVVSGLR
jgi:hypothetical protein